MIACSCKEIIMGKQSNLGPIDPQFNGISTYAVREEFQNALREITEHPETIPIWQVIISKYHPTFIGECEKSIEWASEIVKAWLCTGMFENDPACDAKAAAIVAGLSNHTETKSHSRHITVEECMKFGLKIVSLEDYMKEQNFQDCILTIHHSFMHTFSNSAAYKIVENHEEKAMIQNQQFQQMIQFQPPQNMPLIDIQPPQLDPTL